MFRLFSVAPPVFHQHKELCYLSACVGLLPFHLVMVIFGIIGGRYSLEWNSAVLNPFLFVSTSTYW